MNRRVVASCAVVTSLIGLTACSNAASNSGTPESIADIIVGDITITADPSGTTATVDVDTSIPVACAIIYGTDDNFGQLAVDNDMQGGAHENHGPLLTGLEPDTDYQYILQGSDANGVFYRSDIMSFRTPPATESALGNNIAPTATINDASSEFSDQFAAGLAIDGDPATEWSTNGDGDGAWIEIDLGRQRNLTGVTLRTRQMSDGKAIIETFTITTDDGTIRGPFDAGHEPATFESPITTQRVRLDAERSTGGNTGAVEIEIFAT